MSNELALVMDDSKIELLKTTICKGSTDEEFQLFLHACKRTGLDPFMKQIHAVKRWDSATKREVMSIQTGIDGFRLIADRSGRFCPGREPTFTYDKDGNLLSATAYVKKQTKDGTWHEVPATAFYQEYVQKTKEGKPTKFWATMPHGQLAKCAEALALRKAFPAELSGLYAKEEMEQADNETVHEKKPIAEVLKEAAPVNYLSDDELGYLNQLFVENDDERKKMEKVCSDFRKMPKSMYEKVVSRLEQINAEKMKMQEQYVDEVEDEV